MENANAKLVFVQALLDAVDMASARSLLQEKASEVDGIVVESLIFLAKNYSEQGNLELADQLCDLAIDASAISGDLLLQANSQFIKALVLQYGSYLMEARIHYRLAADFYEKLDEKLQLANCLGNLGLIAQDLGNPSEAVEYHRASLRLTNQMGDINGQLADLTNIAAVCYAQGDYPQAEQRYQEVYALAVEAGEKEDEMNALAGLGLICRARGDLSGSRNYLERAIVIAREIEDRRSETSFLGNLGLVYQDLGDLSRALELHETAQKMHAELGNRQGQANQLGNMANVYYGLGNLPAAESLHLRSLELHRATGDQRGQAEELGNLALVRRVQGNYAEAITLSSAALQIDQELGDRRGEAADWGNLGILYTQLGNYEAARQCIVTALNLDREIGYVQDELNHLNNLAELDYRLGNVSAALENYHQALHLNEQLGYIAGVVHELGNIGTVLLSLGQVQEGREYLQRALALNQDLGNKRTRAADLASLSNARVLMGEVTEALEDITEAVNLAAEALDTDLLTRGLIIRGDIYRDQGQAEAAYKDYASAVEQLERVRISIIEEQHQIGFFARDKAEVYERLIRILLTKRMLSSALDVVQQAKSRSLLHVLSRSDPPPSPTGSEDLIARERELITKMKISLNLAEKSLDETERLRRSAEVVDVNNQLMAIWDSLSNSSEEYADIRRGMPLRTPGIRGLLCVV
jgi:tetratricopeptide (TPR) repeat protein